MLVVFSFKKKKTKKIFLITTLKMSLTNSLIQKIRNACIISGSSLPFKNFDQIERKKHVIVQFMLIQTKYGEKTAVMLNDCIVFLPARASGIISNQDECDELNAKGPYIMNYIGKNISEKNRVVLDIYKQK